MTIQELKWLLTGVLLVVIFVLIGYALAALGVPPPWYGYVTPTP